ncbi:hypothetical protein ACKWTF_002720 [Chironomus riparius]
MSSFYFGADESLTQGAYMTDQNCINNSENQDIQVHSEPCEILTPEINFELSIQDPKVMQSNQCYSQLAENILSSSDAMPTQFQRIQSSQSTNGNREKVKLHEKSRNRSVFRSRKSQSRGSGKSRSRSARKPSVIRRKRFL